MQVVKTPGSVNAQQGNGGPGLLRSGVRSGGSNQGKLHITGSRRYVAHRVTRGQ